MRAIRIALGAALVLVVVLAIRRDIVARYQCSAEKKRTEQWLETARESGSYERRLSVARGAIPRLMQCVESDPSDFEALFLLGVARREAEQPEAALQAFRAALALNERPEIHLAVGLLELEAGRYEVARSHLLPAVFFHANMIRGVSPTFGVELYAEAEKRRDRLLAAAGR